MTYFVGKRRLILFHFIFQRNTANKILDSILQIKPMESEFKNQSLKSLVLSILDDPPEFEDRSVPKANRKTGEKG